MPASQPDSAPISVPSQLAPHVVVVGGGFGGLAAARKLSASGVWVTLIDRRNHHLFQPLLYQVAMAGLSPADIAVPIRGVLHRQGNSQVLLGEVERVKLRQRTVVLTDGEELPYQYLILAAGSQTNFFGHEEDWGRHAQGLKSIEDALDIRRRVLFAFEAAERETDPEQRKRLLTFVVIGGGPTGVEIAGALAELARRVLADDFRVIQPAQARVLIVEMQQRLLPGGFDATLADAARVQLEELGVEVQLGRPVEAIDAQGIQIGEQRIEAATMLWTAGVKPASLASALGVELHKGKIPVNQDCSLPNHPEVFAIGDIAHFVPEGSDTPLPGLAPVATQQGRYVARAIRARIHKQKLGPFRYRDKGIMATVGRSRAVAQTGALKLRGVLAWLAWLVIHLWFLIGFRNRVMVVLNWFWNYLTYRRGARLITGEYPDELHAAASRRDETAASIREAAASIRGRAAARSSPTLPEIRLGEDRARK